MNVINELRERMMDIRDNEYYLKTGKHICRNVKKERAVYIPEVVKSFKAKPKKKGNKVEVKVKEPTGYLNDIMRLYETGAFIDKTKDKEVNDKNEREEKEKKDKKEKKEREKIENGDGKKNIVKKVKDTDEDSDEY